MYETAPPPPPPPPPAPVAAKPAGRKLPLVHLIFAAVLFLFVCGGYIPSMNPPKADLEEEILVPRNATGDEAAKIEEKNKKIREENAQRQDETQAEVRKWANGGEERMRKWIFFCQILALLTAVLWVIYTVVTSVIKPLLRFLADAVGPEFSALLAPLIILGVLSVLARLVLQVTSQIKGHTGVVAALIEYPKHIADTFCSAIVDFTDLVLRNWVIGCAYLLVIIYTVLKKYFRPRY